MIDSIFISDRDAELIADERQPVGQRLDALVKGRTGYASAAPYTPAGSSIGSRRGL